MMTPEKARKLVASAEKYADDDKRAVLAEIIDAGELVDALLTVASLRYEYDYEVAFGVHWTPQGYEFATSKDIARKLEYAGLLAPDLPEPSRRSIEGYHTAHPWAEWDAGNNRVMALKEGFVSIQDVEEPELCIGMPPDEAREAAHALLAAADEAEGQQK